MDFGTEPGPRMGRVIRGRSPATSISYHESGSHLFVASEEDSVLRVVDCLREADLAGGKPHWPNMIKMQNHGIRIVRSTHHGHCILFSPGTNADGVPSGRRTDVVYYHSVHDNKILREFGGHTGSINGICISPVNDTFLSSSVDGTVRLWDCGKGGNSLAELRLPPEFVDATTLAAFDSTGLVFGITAAMPGGDGYHVHLYDARNYTVGPFAEMKTTRQDIEAKIRIGGTSPERAYALSRAEWTSMEFNESGKQILVGTVGGVALTLDGYEGTVHHSYQAETAVGHNTTGASSKALPMAACFTRDGLSVMCGNDDGTISCYQADTGLLVRKIRGHPDRVGAIAANPKYKQFASACTNTAVWIW